MPRTLAERVADPAYWGEQAAHLLLIAAPPVAIILGCQRAAFGGWQLAAGVGAALWITGVRELVDQWPIESVGDMLVDSAFTVAGGALAGLLFLLIAPTP